MEIEVTFCSVLYHHHEQIRLNKFYFERLNESYADMPWLITDNTPADQSVALELPNMTLFPGIEGGLKPNLQHTLGLNQCLPSVDTRFLIVLDPDFYVVVPNWLPQLLQHMDENSLPFWGVPWHPSYANKYRYFPCVHFIVIDTDRVPIEQLDFRPALTEGQAPYWVKLLGLEGRHQTPLDTGTLLYQRFADRNGYPCELATPVWRSAPETRPLKSKALDWLLPDKLAYLPKRNGYFTKQGFAELGLDIGLDPRWEEFTWRGRPFGFHMRMNIDREGRGKGDEMHRLMRSLARATGIEYA